MAGLGLTNALLAYQQGKDWSQQQAEVQRQQQIRDQINAANAAGAQALQQQQAEHDAQQQAALDAWTSSGKNAKEFQAQPFNRDQAYINAMDARGNALAKAGLFDEWTKNFAAAAPLRERMRTKTLDAAEQQYRLDGDLGKYAKTVYGAVHDGRDITDFSKDSTGGLGFKAASGKVNAGEALPEDRYTVTFSDGHKVTHSAKEIQDLIMSARDPAAMHKYEFEQRLLAAKRDNEIAAEGAKEKARGDQARKTAEQAHGFKMEEIGLSNTGRSDVAQIRVDARTSGGGGGGKGGNVQSVQTDADGYKVLVFRDGTTKRLALDGKPVRGESWSKRVDSLANDLSKTPDGFRKSTEELRAQAETMLVGKAVPDESAPSPAPAAPKKAGSVDLNQFFKR